MKRIDSNRIDYVGGVLVDLYQSLNIPVETARTDVEDYHTDLLLYRDGQEYNLEIKTLKQKYYFDPRYMTGQTPANFITLNNDTANSKWERLTRGSYDGLCVLTSDRLYIFNHDDLLRAYSGNIDMKCRHTKELGNSRWSVERKAVVDLDKCKCTLNITPPSDLFV